ncbi:T9SS type A sorting domain-containing protein [Candidatus Dependentiae bacterium]|nr:T9SS type A sorting domain-containing protein [Candidatus Dependentiae bacterium]
MYKRMWVLILLIIFNSTIIFGYSIFTEPSQINFDTIGISDNFDIKIKFDAGDTGVQSITTLLRWDTSVMKYISHTNDLPLWTLSSPVINVNENYPSHNTANGIFFYDYAGFDTYTGLNQAHTITFQLINKKNDGGKIDIEMGNIIFGGFSGSGLISEWGTPGQFLALVQDSDCLVDTSAPMDLNLDNVVVFPNPFVPNDGNWQTGTDYSPANPSSGILVKGLTNDCKIEIYTVLGELVYEHSISTVQQGKIIWQWPVINKKGKPAASGIYFIMIKGAGQTVVKKVAVVR